MCWLWKRRRKEKEEQTMPQYTVHHVNLGKTAQLDALAHAAGQVYSRALVFALRGRCASRAAGWVPST
jgi:hypothetical protein